MDYRKKLDGTSKALCPKLISVACVVEIELQEKMTNLNELRDYWSKGPGSNLSTEAWILLKW